MFKVQGGFPPLFLLIVKWDEYQNFVTMMYDTLILVLTNEYDPSVNFLNIVSPEVIIHSKGFEYGIPYMRGSLKNLKIRITTDKIKIEGSIHVFFKGNNLESMSFSEFVEAVHILKKILNLPIENARISRLDFSGNIPVKYPVEAYFVYFGQKPRYKKQVMDNGIYYYSGELYLAFYDKIKELKRKRELIPEYFLGKHILRFEMRFLRKLGKSFSLPEVTLKKLMDPSFFYQLCRWWRNKFKSLAMEMESPLKFHPTGSKPQFIEHLALQQITQIGIDNIFKMISGWQIMGEITKKEAYEIRKFIRTRTSEKYPLAENELIKELNRKIKVAARYEI